MKIAQAQQMLCPILSGTSSWYCMARDCMAWTEGEIEGDGFCALIEPHRRQAQLAASMQGVRSELEDPIAERVRRLFAATPAGEFVSHGAPLPSHELGDMTWQVRRGLRMAEIWRTRAPEGWLVVFREVDGSADSVEAGRGHFPAGEQGLSEARDAADEYLGPAS